MRRSLFRCWSGMYFNGEMKNLQKTRAALSDADAMRDAEFIRREFADRLVDRLDDIQNRSFSNVLDLGAGSGLCSLSLLKSERRDVRHITLLEGSDALLHRDHQVLQHEASQRGVSLSFLPQSLHRPSEWSLPLQHYDLCVSLLSLHWADDLHQVISRASQSLRHDCPMLGAVYCRPTLDELRSSLLLADMERRGGIEATRVSAMMTPNDMSQCLSQCGMQLTTLDTEQIQIQYQSPHALLRDLYWMGERASPSSSSSGVVVNSASREVMLACMTLLDQLYRQEGKIQCTWTVLWFIAWTKGQNQQKPLKRGSAKRSLKELNHSSSSSSVGSEENTKY